MPYADFVHLRVHSAYSLSEGAIKIDEIVQLAIRERMPAVAITDSGNLFGALEFAMAASSAGVQPIVGCQIFVLREIGSRHQSNSGQSSNDRVGLRPILDALILLIQDEVGYRNLCTLSSKAFLDSPPGETPRITLGQLERFGQGLIALTGGTNGAIGKLLLEGQIEAAEAMLDRLAALFPGRLYVELMRHGLEAERRIEGKLIDFADRRGLPIVATNDCYFAGEDMYEAHDALLCIAEAKLISADDRRRLTPDHRFRSAEEMRRLFADHPDACDNTLRIAQRCAFMPKKRNPILPPFAVGSVASEGEALRALARESLDERLINHVFGAEVDESVRAALAKPYRERLEYELDVIIEMGFSGYFLIVADFIRWAKRQGIPVGPGRGSGAGSVVAWSLTITDLDPLRFGLLFERFLNPERISMPDFDIDFCQDRRDEVIEYVRRKYGDDHVAQIITFGTLQARAALRDVGRVLGMPYGYVDKICKLVPHIPAKPVKLKEAIANEPELQALRDSDEIVHKLLDIALRLEGLYRHASTHAAGVVIADRPLTELLPLYRDPRSPIAATQFSMKYTENAGLVKFDFLGLKTLTMLAQAREILKSQKSDVDFARLPLDDRKSYELMARGDTVGVFQLESSGMRDVLRQMRPDAFEDIIALVALYRPGPMDNIPRYIACKHGRERPDYLYPTLEGILRETFGVIIYQEQVMQIAQILSGFSLGSADILRRAMGKKIKSEMQAQREAFVTGAVARGVDKGTAAQIFDLVDKFAGYGFNKSHAAAYALISYQTAWLKANHPLAFFAASMTLDLGNTDKLSIFRQDAQRLGIRLLPPDINRSGAGFTVERDSDGQGAIRYALGALRNVGAQAMAQVAEERRTQGAYRDVFDFMARSGRFGVNRRQLESLIRAGAFDSLEPSRRRLLDSIDLLLRHGGSRAEADERQATLFGGDGGPANAVRLAEVPDWSSVERLANEFEAIGFYFSAHPLDEHADSLDRLGVTPYGAHVAADAGGRLRLAGVVMRKQERTSAKGNRYAFVQLSDKSGVFEIVVFSELLSSARDILEPGTRLFVSADSRPDGEGLRLTAHSLARLDSAAADAIGDIRVRIAGPDPLDRVKSLLTQSTKGRGRLSLVLGLGPAQEVEVALPGRYAFSTTLRRSLQDVPGVIAVELC